MFHWRSPLIPALILALTLLTATGAAAQDRFFSIQVSAFRDVAQAENEVGELKSWGLDAFSRVETVEGKGDWHRFYVGRFASKAEAAAEADQIKSEGIVSDFVIREVDTTMSAAAPSQDKPPVQPAPGPSAPSEPGEEVLEEPAAGSDADNPFIDDFEESGASPTPSPTPVGEPLTTEPAPGPTEEVIEEEVIGSSPAPVPVPAPLPAEESQPAPAPQTASTQLPPGLPAGTIPADPPPDSWEIIVDLSGSTADTFGCSGFTKQEAQLAILRKLNAKIPDLEYQAAMRQFAYKRAYSRADYTKLIYGPTKFDRQDFQQALGSLTQSDAITPLGWSIAATEEDLLKMPGKRSLIIISDFTHNMADFGQPVDKCERLCWKLGEDFNIYSICSSVDVKDVQLAKEIAGTTKGGKYYDGCRLIKDETYFDVMVAEVFGVHVAPPEPVCIDEDLDGICDDQDQCPRTPKGAPVDNRGCWITAFSQFFDFDKAIVKDEFLPRIESSAEIIKNNPHLTIMIAGHTDNKGSDEYNMKLGLRRAEAVKEKLVGFGVQAELLKTQSYGESQPVAGNDTDDGRTKNRRVELHVWEPGAAPPPALQSGGPAKVTP